MTTHESYHVDRFKAHWRRFYQDPSALHARNLANRHADYLKATFGYTADDITGLKREAEFAARNGVQS